MTTQIVYGELVFSDGGSGLFNGTDGAAGANTDETAVEIKSDATFYVTASSAGDQFPGRTITAANFSAKTIPQWVYVLSREGTVAAMLPVSSRTAGSNTATLPLCRPYTLRAGDTIQSMTRA